MKGHENRNFLITQSYHQISAELSKRLGTVANWCSFATWASKQAGQTIRKEDIATTFEQYLKTSPEVSTNISKMAQGFLLKGSKLKKSDITQLLWEAVDPYQAIERASDAVARGNRKVYAEIAREFARFLETFKGDKEYNQEKITAFCKSLKAGPPPKGQQFLKQAFERYYTAFFELNPKKKAQLILHANLEIGFHEQTRLQPEIAEALEASFVVPKGFQERLIKNLFPNPGLVRRVLDLLNQIFGSTLTKRPLNRFSKLVHKKMRTFMTDHIMILDLPGYGPVNLGNDLVAEFPELLKSIDDPDLIKTLEKIDPTKDSLKGTGAIDWANLYHRLHFIADLFRSFQEDSKLLDPPFGERFNAESLFEEK